MLIEIWEHLRGYDKWAQTNAVVCRSGTEQVEHQGRYGTYFTTEAGDVIEWTDPTGEKQYADFNAPEGSKLFQLTTGDTVEIRYNPAKPDDFYYRDLLQLRVRQAAGATLVVLFVLSFYGLMIWARMH
jgi:ribosomal 30S subunit maturation factor RimM